MVILEGSVAAGSNKGRSLFQPIWHTDPGSAGLHSTHWYPCLLGPHLTTHKTTSWSNTAASATLRTCAALRGSRAVTWSFLWLNLTVVKAAGANCSIFSTAAYSHPERLGSCFLDIFTAFNILPSFAQREAWCDAGAQFLHHRLCRQDFLDLFFFFCGLWRGRFPFTFPAHSLLLWFHIHLFFFFELPLLWEAPTWAMREAEEFCWQRKKEAGFESSWSKKPLTYVTLHPGRRVKVMQRCKIHNVTTKMSNNGGTCLRGQREGGRLHLCGWKGLVMFATSFFLHSFVLVVIYMARNVNYNF